MKRCILIPARSGSKGLYKKNLYQLKGKPLISHVIDAALMSSIDDIWVSTDCEEIKEVSVSHMINVIDRPKNLAKDLSTDLCVFSHFVQNLNIHFDYIVHLRATFPKVTSKIIDDASNVFENNFNEYDSLRSVIKSKENPYKMWHINNNKLETVISNNLLHSSPRQIIPTSYTQNACIDIIKPSTIINKKSMVGDACFPYIMPNNFDFDIDTLEDIRRKL